jgi:hypothetical protein
MKKGQSHSAETRARIAAAKKDQPGRPQSPETRARISAAHKGRHHVPGEGR